jgi:hypothetical protein
LKVIKKIKLIKKNLMYEVGTMRIHVKENKYRMIAGIILITIGVLCRITFTHLLPHTPSLYLTLNGITQPLFMLDVFFVVAVIAFLSGYLLGGYYSFIIPLSVMIISDTLLGNTFIFLFTWSGFALIGLIGYYLQTKRYTGMSHVPTILGGSIGAILLYDVFTNFGSWLGWYPHTLQGLTLCYTLAVPFTLWHLLSTTIALTMIIVPVMYLQKQGLSIPTKKLSALERKVTYLAPSLLVILSLTLYFV